MMGADSVYGRLKAPSLPEGAVRASAPRLSIRKDSARLGSGVAVTSPGCDRGPLLLQHPDGYAAIYPVRLDSFAVGFAVTMRDCCVAVSEDVPGIHCYISMPSKARPTRELSSTRLDGHQPCSFGSSAI